MEDETPESKPNRKPRKLSAVWMFFEKTSQEEGKASCKLCGFKLSNGIGRNASTSCLRNHLHKKHPEEYQLMINGEGKLTLNESSAEPRPKKCRGVVQPSPESSMSSLTQVRKTTSNVTTPGSRVKKSRGPVKSKVDTKLLDIKDETTLHYAIAEMIAVDNQPYSLVENNGFQRMMKIVQPHYKIPDRIYFLEKIFPDIFERVNTAIRGQIQTASWLSLTSDVLTCSSNSYSLISFTAHWLSTDFEMLHAVLIIKYFPGHHTSRDITLILEEMIHDWELTLDRVHVLIRNNGASIQKGVEDVGISSVDCFLHNLQLVINDSITCQHSVNDMIGKSRCIVEHFCHSFAASSELWAIQTELDMPQKQLVEDVPTRWISTFYMLQRLIEQKVAIAVYCSRYYKENACRNLTSDDWNLMEATISILEPFEQLTKKISSSKSLISEVIPYVNTLKEYLSYNNAAHFGVGAMKGELTKCLTQQFRKIESIEYFTISTFLDPRYKMRFFSDEGTIMQTKQLILAKIEEQCNISILVNTVTSIPTENYESQNANSPVSFFQYLQNKTSKVPLRGQNSDHHSLELELNAYISGELCPGEKCILDWWKNNKYLYPNLARLVLRYLCAPASIVCWDGLFSEPGLIYENNRNRLTSEHDERLLFLHHNLPILKMNY